ncbi:sugar kinase [Lentzea guizhouensis]|uniref:Sugar kinase n=1 Tax=Lentzea guizhouensis TaxID=1586287 RepID=A0A1B2HTY6_9PSEU|nr:ROK family transcriptional regulator [Lentzea guizhouensis]ANZ41199.1 sugar kinase [Lentzea guizhouensis]
MPDVPWAPAASPGQLLRLLLDGVPRTRAELANQTGLTRAAVRTRLDALQGAGFLTDGVITVATGGRPAGRLAFNAGARTVLAADVGASHATVAVTDLAGGLLASRRLALDVATGPERVLGALARTWREMVSEAGLSAVSLAGVGIGLPGPVEHSTGRPNNPPIMPTWNGFDVPGHLRAEFGVPVLVDNEVNLMALGEHAHSFPGTDHMIVVKVATGIGSGFISNGVLHRGAAGAAGDLGHIRVPDGDDADCGCGNSGCLEAVASGSAVAARLRAKGVDAHTSADVVALVRAGNVEAGQAIRQAGRTIGEVLAACVSMVNPSLIVVGGDLAAAGEMLLAGVREAVYRRSLPLATENLRIVPSRTGEVAGVLGAAAMVIHHVLSPAVVDQQLG